MSLREESPGTPGRCEIEGCLKGEGRYVVVKAGSVRKVCRRCGQEMTAMHGWTVIDTIGDAPLRTTGGAKAIR